MLSNSYSIAFDLLKVECYTCSYFNKNIQKWILFSLLNCWIRILGMTDAQILAFTLPTSNFDPHVIHPPLLFFLLTTFEKKIGQIFSGFFDTSNKSILILLKFIFNLFDFIFLGGPQLHVLLHTLDQVREFKCHEIFDGILSWIMTSYFIHQIIFVWCCKTKWEIYWSRLLMIAGCSALVWFPSFFWPEPTSWSTVASGKTTRGDHWVEPQSTPGELVVSPSFWL